MAEVGGWRFQPLWELRQIWATWGNMVDGTDGNSGHTTPK